MKENLDKAQYWTDGPDSRRQALANYLGYDYNPKTHDHITILGITIAPTGTHPTNYNEKHLQPRQKKQTAPTSTAPAATAPKTANANAQPKRKLVLLPSPQPPKQQPKHAPDAHLPPHQPTATVEHSKLLKQLHHNHPSNKLINHDSPQPGMRLMSILQKQRGSWPHNVLYRESAAYHMHGTTRHDLLAQQPYPKQHTDGCTTFHP